MPAPVESYIQLPSDSGNTGKKIRAQSRVVGANTVYSHFYATTTNVNLKGVYFAQTLVTVSTVAAQNGTTTATFWMQLPIDSPVNARIRRFTFHQHLATTGDVATATRIFLSRITHNGGWSGALLSTNRRKVSDAAPLLDMRTASTGSTVTLGNPLWSFLLCGSDVTTSGNTFSNGTFVNWIPFNEQEFIELVPGEGLVFWQADISQSASNNYFFNILWDEYDNT